MHGSGQKASSPLEWKTIRTYTHTVCAHAYSYVDTHLVVFRRRSNSRLAVYPLLSVWFGRCCRARPAPEIGILCGVQMGWFRVWLSVARRRSVDSDRKAKGGGCRRVGVQRHVCLVCNPCSRTPSITLSDIFHRPGPQRLVCLGTQESVPLRLAMQLTPLLIGHHAGSGYGVRGKSWLARNRARIGAVSIARRD